METRFNECKGFSLMNLTEKDGANYFHIVLLNEIAAV